jgi:hypothetical protein
LPIISLLRRILVSKIGSRLPLVLLAVCRFAVSCLLFAICCLLFAAERLLAALAKNKIGKIFAFFAKLSPFNPFRINKPPSGSPKICAKIRRVRDKQLV